MKKIPMYFNDILQSDGLQLPGGNLSLDSEQIVIPGITRISLSDLFGFNVSGIEKIRAYDNGQVFAQSPAVKGSLIAAFNFVDGHIYGPINYVQPIRW